MLKQIKIKIKKYRKVKYQKVLFSKKDLALRDRAIQHISRLDLGNKKKIASLKSPNFYYKNLDKKNFIIFYKKFNSNIELKEKYNLKTLKKSSKKEACFKSYIIFSKFLMKNKEINNIQKLNTILKINDLLILLFNKNKHTNLIWYFKNNIEYEKKLISLYL